MNDRNPEPQWCNNCNSTHAPWMTCLAAAKGKSMKTILHAGCGSKSNKVPERFRGYRDVRLDVNKNVEPDLVMSIVAMPAVDSEAFDAVHCSHCLEHLTAVEGALALREFLRVLKPGGELSLQVPDLQGIGGKIGLGQIDYVLYNSAMGPITPLDMLYGMQSAIGAGNLHMAHKTGFTAGSLSRILTGAGFERVETKRGEYELFATAFKGDGSDQTSSRADTALQGDARDGGELSGRQPALASDHRRGA